MPYDRVIYPKNTPFQLGLKTLIALFNLKPYNLNFILDNNPQEWWVKNAVRTVSGGPSKNNYRAVSLFLIHYSGLFLSDKFWY